MGRRRFESALLEVGQRPGVGAGEDVEQRVGKGHALLRAQGEDERADRLVDELAALGEIRKMLEFLPAHLPREAVVLP